MTNEREERISKYLKQRITRRQAIKAGALAALGITFSRPLINTIRPKPAFASGYGTASSSSSGLISDQVSSTGTGSTSS